jgi:glutamyl-tRNA synthetase
MAKQKKQSLLGKVRTRVAPSPTGFPHVGTAFQALFDWVYAKRYDGQFILRIEDTDQKRFVKGAEEALYEALDWLGLQPDESPRIGGPVAPYRQSERLDLYRQYAKQLVEQGDAYYCFCSPERLQKLRQEQQKQGIPPKYDRHCLSLSKQEVEKKLKNGEPAVIRMKVPDDREIVVNDVLRGQVRFDSNIVDDQVLLKSDGFPTYHLAVVVDDHLMKITHVERGEEWLPSAPKHVLLYQFFDWKMPKWIHTPTLRNPDRSKLSKRKGNTSLWWYREQGYLPAALLNFLGLLVWKPAENQEMFSLQAMIDKFEWREMNVTGPIFDIKKLAWLNGKYMRQLDKNQLKKQVLEWAQWVESHGKNQDNINKAQQILQWSQQKSDVFERALPLSSERARTLLDLHDLLEFYFLEELDYDRDDLLQGQSASEMSVALSEVKERLSGLEPYNAKTWEQTIRDTADQYNLSHKDLFMSLRSAITAQQFTPPLFEVMEAIGKTQSFKRIEQAVRFLSNSVTNQ